MNLRDLKYLVAVAEHKHFGNAARLCFVSQPTLSMQLKKLEESLGVQLFERTNKQVHITPIGELLVKQAQDLLAQADRMVATAKAHQDPLAGDFRLGIFPTLAPYYLPQIIAMLHRKLPKIRFLLLEEKSDILIQKLHAGLLDAAMLALPVEGDGLHTAPLFEDPFLLAVPTAHRLAKQASVRHRDLKGEALLLLEDGHCLRSQALEACSLIGMSEHQEFQATSLETLRQMVVAGVGITLIPKIAATKSAAIRYIPFEGAPPSRSIGLVWRRQTARTQCIHELQRLLQNG